jgi:hypothetical protein
MTDGGCDSMTKHPRHYRCRGCLYGGDELEKLTQIQVNVATR